MIVHNVDWDDLKDFIDARGVSPQYIETDNYYSIAGIDGPFVLSCKLIKNGGADQTAFEASYKAAGNKKLEYLQNLPFDSKKLSDGKSLFRRVHGVKQTLSGDTDFDLVIPYNQCKINGLEIVWAPAGLQVDLKVYDTPTGTISTVPNYMLNQFGFGTGVAKDFYEETSNYDADLIKDMKVKCTILNPDSLTDTICVNFILHEVK